MVEGAPPTETKGLGSAQGGSRGTEVGGRGVGKQGMGWRAATQGRSRLPMILLRMVCSSLTLISMSWGKREDGTHSGERLPLGAPDRPSTTPSLPPLPVV